MDEEKAVKQLHEPLVLDLGPDLSRVLRINMKDLEALICSPETLIEFRQSRGIEIDADTKRLIEELVPLRRKLFIEGIHMWNDYYNLLTFRYVHGDGKPIEELIRLTKQFGGKDPKDSKPWIHADSATHVGEFMNGHYPNDPGLLLIYKANMLTPITEEDTRAFPMRAQYYGLKPKINLTFNDALLAIIPLRA